jgi:hypothetical protein
MKPSSSSNTALALNTHRPGNSLALWLAIYAPDLFAAVVKKCAAGAKATKLGRLGQDDIGDDLDVGDDTSLYDTDVPDLGTSSIDAGVDSSVLNSTDPLLGQADLETVVVSAPAQSADTSTDTSFIEPVSPASDLSTTDPLVLTASSPQVQAASSAATSTGTTVGQIASSVGSTVLSALGAAGAALSTPQAAAALAQTATAYYNAQANASALSAEQAALAAQLVGVQASRAAAGQTAAPITVQNGTPYLTSVGANGATTYTPLSSAQLASLAPSGVSSFLAQYGNWIAIAAVVAFIGYFALRGAHSPQPAPEADEDDD